MTRHQVGLKHLAQNPTKKVKITISTLSSAITQTDTILTGKKHLKIFKCLKQDALTANASASTFISQQPELCRGSQGKREDDTKLSHL